jgi:hypothetical protein
MLDAAEKRGQIIRHLDDALVLADELEDGQTGFLIERALDEARSRQFMPVSESRSTLRHGTRRAKFPTRMAKRLAAGIPHLGNLEQ